MLNITNLTRRFGKNTAVDNVTIEIEEGQMVGVIGRSGAGKSTLLRMINRLVDPSVGSIHFDGRDVSTLRGAPLRNWQRDCAMIFQQFNLVGRMDVLTNVLMGRLDHVGLLPSLLRVFPYEDKLLALAALEQLDMGSYVAQRAETLSGGQQQRVAIARALVHDPPLIVCDEPTSALDRENGRRIMELLRDAADERDRTVIIVTHDPRIYSYADRMAEMEDGRISRLLDSPTAIAAAHPDN